MHVSKLELSNWKNFRKASANLTHRTFLIGPNAAGKSNLLDALRFLRDVAGSGLATAVEKRDGVSAIRCLAARQSPSVEVAVTLSDGVTPLWTYTLEFTQDASRRPRVRRELVVAMTRGQTVLARPSTEDNADPELLSQTALEQISANKDFRVISEFFASVSYQHLVPQVVRDPREFTAAPVRNDPFGRDLLLRIWNTPTKTRGAWLNRITRVLQSAVPQLQSLSVEMDESQGVPHLVGRYAHWRAHGAKQNEAQFSDGTLRLFGLMWAMFEGSGPLLLEEPELSLHPEVIRVIPRLLARLQQEIRKMKRKGGYQARQIIISTHSEELLSDPSIAANEVLRIEPGAEGSMIMLPDAHDLEAMSHGLTAADVLLPKAAPSLFQMQLPFQLE